MVAKERILDVAVARGVEKTSPEAVQAVADTIQSLLADTLPLAKRTLAFAVSSITLSESLLEQAIKNPAKAIPPREGWPAFSNSTVSTSANAIGLIREMAGLKPGTATLPISNQKARIVRHTVETPAEKVARLRAQGTPANAHTTESIED